MSDGSSYHVVVLSVAANMLPRSSRNRFARVIKLLNVVQNGGSSVNSLASRLRCCRRTVFRDIDLLKASGAAIEFDEYLGKYTITRSKTKLTRSKTKLKRYTATPEEIRQRCKEIQQRWSYAKRKTRQMKDKAS